MGVMVPEIGVPLGYAVVSDWPGVQRKGFEQEYQLAELADRRLHQPVTAIHEYSAPRALITQCASRNDPGRRCLVAQFPQELEVTGQIELEADHHHIEPNVLQYLDRILT